MKRFKFGTQLMILFVGLIVLSLALFAVLVAGRLSSVSESQTLERLDSIRNASKESWSTGSELTEISKDDFSVAYIQGQAMYRIEGMGKKSTQISISSVSENLSDFVGTKNLNSLVDDISFNANTEGHSSITFSGNEIFYSYGVTEENDNGVMYYIIFLTDKTFAESFRFSIAFQMIVIFSLVLVFAFIILGLWGGAYTSRINRLKLHIKHLPSSEYKEEYKDDGKDELSDLSDSIERMRLELLRNESIKQEMLQNISHDFKTPIAVIKSYAEAIQDGMASESDAQIIINQANNLQHKVVRLLQYNSLEYLQKDKEFEQVNMQDVVRSVINANKYNTNDIEFIDETEECYFEGYKENYYTVIENLVDNAKRYAKTKIVISIKDNVLKVYNDGEHIEEQFLNGLFKPYEKGSKGQFGLGMSIVKKTLDFFGYEISVKNENLGVTFTIKRKENTNIYLE